MAPSSSNRRGVAAILFLAAANVAVGDADRLPQGRSSVLPISFEANHGQVDPQVKFVARFANYRLYLTGGEAVVAGNDSTPIRMSVIGMRRDAVVEGEQPLPGKAHYLIGGREQWRTDIPTFRRVRYRNAYPGIDVVYYGTDRRLEYDFLVEPGADPAQIEVQFSGMTSLTLEASGDLALAVSPSTTFTFEKPRLYQTIDDTDHEVRGGYRLVGSDRIRFHVGDYDKRLPLVIDPILRSTYLGGFGSDEVLGLGLDADSNIIIAGKTSSVFPVTPGAFDSGPDDIYIVKANASGTAIIFATYLGGSRGEVLSAMVADAAGNSYITGSTVSEDFPVVNAVQPNWKPAICGEFGGLCGDLFVTKLNPSGSGLVYSTYFGGSRSDQPGGVDVDSDGNLYVTGTTDSFDFPTRNPLIERGGGFTDAFLTKFDAAGALVYSTYLGGSGADRGFDVAVDALQNAYVTGGTDSSNFPVLNAIQPNNVNFGEDAFISKVNAAGTGFVYSTYLGGNQTDRAWGIDADAAGNAYVAGITTSTNFPTISPVQPVLRGPNDVFVAKVNSAGSALLYSTYLGGNDREQAPFDLIGGRAVSIDASDDGTAYVSGHTSSADFPSPVPFGGGMCTVFPLQPQIPCPDAFVTALTPNGAQIAFSNLLGGNDDDRSRAVLAAPDGTVVVGGVTQSANFPTVDPLMGRVGATDGFIAHIGPDKPPCALAAPSKLVAVSTPPRWTFSWQPVDGADQYIVSITPLGDVVLTGRPRVQELGVTANPSFTTPTGLGFVPYDYVWQVVPWSAACGAGTPSQGQIVTIDVTCPLKTPVLISPVDTEVNNPARFVWTNIVGTSIYYLMLFEASTGRLVSQHASYFGGALREFTLPSTLSRGQYFWVVAAWSASCGPAVSAPGVFRSSGTVSP